MRVYLLILSLCCPLTGCLDVISPSPDCAELYSRTKGFGLENNSTTPLTLILEECAVDNGQNCNSHSLISKEAAICIAKIVGPDRCVGWQALLTYHFNLRRIVWIIENRTDKNACQKGSAFVIDATTGDILRHSGWDSCS